jgi:integrase
MKAMILLALNGGFGSQELSELTKPQADLARKRLKHRRGKTGAEHFLPLWPETAEALRVVLGQRPDDELLFRTREGNPWVHSNPKMVKGHVAGGSAYDHVNWTFTQLVKPIGLKIEGQGFYKLKHLACTTGDAAGDAHATYAVYGHKLPGAKGHYVDVGYDRQLKVVDHVRHVLLVSPLEDPQVPLPQPPARARTAARGMRERLRASRAGARSAE